MNTKQLKSELKKFTLSSGADLFGIAEAKFLDDELEHLSSFVKDKRHGDMNWMEDFKKRLDPEKILPGAKSVIVIAVNYYREQPPTKRGYGRIARYAYGRDYHKVLKGILKKIAAHLEILNPECQSKICVDSAPILEKAYAVKAGLGFIGKNTTLITKEFGSFVLLGEILTTAELASDAPATGTCGTCTRCLDACPTKALTAAHTMDARRCISYLTIEHRRPIEPELASKMGNLIFGCDICQEVCPYNKSSAKPIKLIPNSPLALTGFFDPIAGSELDLQLILAMETEPNSTTAADQSFLNRFAGSPVMRTKRAGLIRNAKIAISNSKNQSTLPP